MGQESIVHVLTFCSLLEWLDIARGGTWKGKAEGPQVMVVIVQYAHDRRAKALTESANPTPTNPSHPTAPEGSSSLVDYVA